MKRTDEDGHPASSPSRRLLDAAPELGECASLLPVEEEAGQDEAAEVVEEVEEMRDDEEPAFAQHRYYRQNVPNHVQNQPRRPHQVQRHS